MMKCKMSCLVLLLMALPACAYFRGDTRKQEPTRLPTYQHQVIALENLTSRVIAYCYATPEFSAEECAAELEEYGYVRLNDVPRFTAADSQLNDTGYPTRRWRDDNVFSRW